MKASAWNTVLLELCTLGPIIAASVSHVKKEDVNEVCGPWANICTWFGTRKLKQKPIFGSFLGVFQEGKSELHVVYSNLFSNKNSQQVRCKLTSLILIEGSGARFPSPKRIHIYSTHHSKCLKVTCIWWGDNYVGLVPHSSKFCENEIPCRRIHSAFVPQGE